MSRASQVAGRYLDVRIGADDGFFTIGEITREHDR